MKNPELSIIIPAMNEEKRMPKPLEELCQYIETTGQKEFGGGDKNSIEVVIVVNNCTDNTEQVVKEFKKKYSFIRHITIPMRTGKGGALAIGFNLARGRYIAFRDADGSSSLEELIKVCRKIRENPGTDIVITNRYGKDSQIVGGMPLKRLLYSRLFNTVAVRGIFGLNYADTQCGLKAFNKQTAKLIADRFTSLHWTFDLNLLLLAKYLKLNIREVDTIWQYRPGTTLSFRSLFTIPMEIIKLKKMEIWFILNKLLRRKIFGNVTKEDLMSTKKYPWAEFGYAVG